MLMCKSFSSQKGFSLIRSTIFLVILAIFALGILNFLPYLHGGPFDVINQIIAKAKTVVNGIISKFSGIVDALAKQWTIIKEKLAWKIEDLKDWLYRRSFQGKPVSSRALEWDKDITTLIELAKEHGYDMQAVNSLRDQGNASSKRVEAEFWNQIQNQTVDFINKNINRFRTRPLGCSDFTDELIKIWTIGQQFNAETLEGYFEAKTLSEELQDPRSLEFAQDIFGWLGFPNHKWFMDQLAQALPNTQSTPNYPAIIEQINARLNGSANPFERVLGNIVMGEIYLNYDLINPAEDRFDEALRNLSGILIQYEKTIPPASLVGLHMALGLLNERVCRNNDLAIKEFKDVIACAKRIGLKCENYNIAHYQLGIINLKLREGNQVKPQFDTKAPQYKGTTEDLLTTTPTPLPTPSPTPTPAPNPIKISIEIPLSRALKAQGQQTPRAMPGVTTRAMPGVTTGEVTAPRPIRLRPRTELGDSQQMKEFKIEDLYDLSNIPTDAIREFELYLQCNSEPARARVAKFIHDKYMGK